MPISTMGDCSENHWQDVLTIITDSVTTAGFSANLVSNSDEVTVIQKTIVQNLYNLPIVICDVSERNPNVMFELGLRLAFDKATIVIKDDKTPFSFDTSVIEHLEYPRDLRFGKIVDFKQRLSEKVLATYDKSSEDPGFSTFLKHFGQFKVASISETEISGQDFIIEQLDSMNKKLESISAPLSPSRRPLNYPAGDEMDICCGPMNNLEIKMFENILSSDSSITSVRRVPVDNHEHLFARAIFKSVPERRDKERKFQELAREMRQKSKLRRLEKNDGDSEIDPKS